MVADFLAARCPFFNAGFFNPQMADQALACLQMMDFEGKEELIRMVGENDRRQAVLDAVLQQLLQMAAAYDEMAAEIGIESNQAAEVQAEIQQITAAGTAASGSGATVPEVSGESSITKNAREEAASAASPT